MKHVLPSLNLSAAEMVRHRLGMTQEAFAVLLGVSRSYLALCEKNKRSLHSDALQKLSVLDIQLSAAASHPPPAMLNSDRVLKRRQLAMLQLECDAHDIKTSIKSLQLKLEEMVYHHQRLSEQQAATGGLIASLLSTCAPGSKEIEQLQLHLYTLQALMDTCDEAARARVEQQLAVQEFALQLVNRRLSQLPG